MDAAALAAALSGLARSLRLPFATARSVDRRFLENVLLPTLDADVSIERLLFVGCAAYTRHYPRLLLRTEFWTMEPQRRRALHGATLHIVDSLQRLRHHVPPAHFDAIVVNGVLGWGLNRRDDAEAALAACHSALRPGGLLVLGWNDVVPRNRIPPATLVALAQFAPVSLKAFSPRLLLPGPERHVYEFYRR
jgi:hypothetical protein